MKVFWKRMVVGLTLAAAIWAFVPVFGAHEKENGITGWERDSNYNKLYDPTEMHKINMT